MDKIYYQHFSYFVFLPVLAFFSLEKGFASELKWSKTTQEIFASPTDTSTSVDFLFTNTSDKTITITNLTTSCGCTAAELNKRIYQPRETGSIRAFFQFAHRLGLQKKQIKVQTDETDSSLTTLHLNVQIPRIVQITPETLLWTKTETTEKILRVTTTNWPNVTIKGISNSNPKIFQVTSLTQTNYLYEWVVKPIDLSKPVKSYLYLQADINGLSRNFRAITEIKPTTTSLSANDKHSDHSVPTH